MQIKKRIDPNRKIDLHRLLALRKTSLEKWIEDFEIETYEQLLKKCEELRFVAPTKEEWNALSSSKNSDALTKFSQENGEYDLTTQTKRLSRSKKIPISE